MARLAQVAVACLLLLGISWQLGLIPRPGRPLRAGTDLLAFYSAGQLVREGQASAMYDRAAVSATQQRIMRQAGIDGDARYLPWMYPPFAALPFAVLAHLPYRTAAMVWLGVNIGLAGMALALFRGMMPGRIPASRTILFGLAVYLSMPMLQALFAQQNTFVSLVLLSLVARSWLAGRGFAAGACAGLMLFKPQLTLVIAGALGISLGIDAIAGFALVATLLLAITAAALPGALTEYIHYLPTTEHWFMMELPFNWGRQVTLQGFWRLAIQGHAVGNTAVAAKLLAWCGGGVVALLLSIAAWRSRGRDEAVRRKLAAAAIVATPMLAPYCMDYDLLLLAVAAALTIHQEGDTPLGEPSGSAAGSSAVGRAMLGGWAAVAVATYFNPFFAATGRWNIAVIALAGMALILLRDLFAHLSRAATTVDRLCPVAPRSALSR